jgi:hypothetical protein
MVFERQKRLLALLDAFAGEVGNLDFQKLLLLYCVDVESVPSYEFVPYRFGGFSFTSYADRRKLVDQGMLADDERTWRLTPAGKAVARVPLQEQLPLRQFARRYQQTRGDALVALTYRRHPYYATRSEMAERLLAGDPAALSAVTAARPAKGAPGLCTIGYEGRTLEGYLNALLGDGVTVLCDVRRNPLSRKYGFSKSTLSHACERTGIRYEHLPQLGIASEERRELHSQRDYDALFASYERDSLPQQSAALALIGAWIAEGERVALTCYEALPQQCHRHCVAEALARSHGTVPRVKHL